MAHALLTGLTRASATASALNERGNAPQKGGQKVVQSMKRTLQSPLQSRVLRLLLCTCTLVLAGLLLLRSGLGQSPAQAQSSLSGGANEVGRYALYHTTPVLTSTSSVPTRVFLLDTKSGRVWERSATSWVDLGPHSMTAR